MYNFDKKVNRLGTDCTKWDRYKSRYNLDDVTALWVADMDFEVEPKISEALLERSKHPVYGYTDVSDEVYDEIIKFEKRHHGVDIKKENIVMNTGVVYALYEILGMITTDKDKVLVMPPIYPPLFNIPKSLKREVVYCPLINDNQKYSVDFNKLDELLTNDKDIKCFILCNPHNPTGNVFSLEEINRFAKICHDHNIWLISDEIHGDLIMPGFKQYSILCANEEYLDKVIAMCAPTKTFNLAGMKVSYSLSKNEEFVKEFNATAKNSGLSSINIFGLEAIKAAYRYGDKWLEECLEYIYGNLKFLKEYLDENVPGVKYEVPQATYLAWLDLRALDLPDDYVERLKFEGHVEFQGGKGFSDEYIKFMRVNCATDRKTLKEGLDRFVAWLKENNII